MSEAEWQSGLPTLEKMVDFCAATGSERKLRLFLYACCDRIEHGLVNARSRAVHHAMGRYLEGPPDPDMLSGLQSLARGAYNAVDAPFDVDDMLDPSAESEAANAVLCLTNPSLSTSWEIGEPSPWTWAAIFARFALHRLVRRTRSRDEANAVEATEMSVQVRMLRCIFGNPFRPVDAIPARLTSDVVALARGMYDARDFSAMPVLGDALQGAGCDNPDVLGHCREPNAVHVRGCWVVDLMLGKE